MTREEILERARVATRVHGGHPPSAWSTGERSAVALLTRSSRTLAQLGMTPVDATVRLADDLQTSPQGADEWVRAARRQIDEEITSPRRGA